MQQFHIKLFYILGCDPNIMGIGPVPASRAALKSIQLIFLKKILSTVQDVTKYSECMNLNQN
jgi:hypothetical protein